MEWVHHNSPTDGQVGCFQFFDIKCNEQCFPEHSNTGLLCTCAQYLEVELCNGTECAFNIFIAVAKLSSKKAVCFPPKYMRGPSSPCILAVNTMIYLFPIFAKLMYEKNSLLF